MSDDSIVPLGPASANAKVELLLVCDEVRRHPKTGRYSAHGIWRRLEVKFPYKARFCVLALFSGEFHPSTISLSLLNAETNQQIDRDVDDSVQQPPPGESMVAWQMRSPEFEFLRPGRVKVKIDADGILPASCEFELAQAVKR